MTNKGAKVYEDRRTGKESASEMFLRSSSCRELVAYFVCSQRGGCFGQKSPLFESRKRFSTCRFVWHFSLFMTRCLERLGDEQSRDAQLRQPVSVH